MNTIETTTESGTRVIITPTEGSNLPSSLSEIASTVQNVSLPSNAQIDETLQGAKEVIMEELPNLSSKGQTLAKEAEEIIDSTSNLLHERNKNDKLQKLISGGKEAALQTAGQLKEQGKNLMEEGKYAAQNVLGTASSKLTGLSRLAGKAQSDAEDLYLYIRHLGYNLLRSEDLRELVADWVQLIQALTSEKIKKQAQKKRKLTHSSKGGESISKGIEEGIQEIPKPASEEELMDQTRELFDRLLKKITKSKEFQKAIQDAYKLYDELKEKLLDVGDKISEEAKRFQSVLMDTLDVLGEFVGAEHIHKFKYILSDLYESTLSDKKLNAWFAQLRTFLTKTLPNAKSLDDVSDDIADLLTKGRAIFSQAKLRGSFHKLSDSINSMVEKVKHDTIATDFAKKLQHFAKDLALNEEGYPDLFVLEESISQMKNMIIPLFKKQLDSLPIKRVEFINDTYDVVLEDMIAVGSGFLPESMDIHMSNDSHIDFMGKEDSMKQQLEIQVAHIKPEFKNMKFHYKRKSFPTISDFGMADLAFNGEGATIHVVWNIETSSGTHPVASLAECSCTIDSLSIRIVGEATKHEFFDTLMAPLVAGLLKNKIAGFIEETLEQQLGNINQQLNQFFASRPTQQLKEKANQVLMDTFQQYQQTVQSV